jgi:hypothetical protein
MFTRQPKSFFETVGTGFPAFAGAATAIRPVAERDNRLCGTLTRLLCEIRKELGGRIVKYLAHGQTAAAASTAPMGTCGTSGNSS